MVVGASVNPIEVHGRFFIDSITKEPVCIFFNSCKLFLTQFVIKGIDYQPGGASSVTVHKDPLSSPEECARDIPLFQELGINVSIKGPVFEFC